MWHETNFLGVYLPPLIIYMLCALAVFLPLRWLMSRTNLLRRLANPPLAEAAIYVCILAMLIGWL
jgi:hypothetical protein